MISIKVLPISFLLLLGFLNLAQASSIVEVELTDGTKLDCSKSQSFPAACTDDKNNRYLVEADGGFANAIKMDANGSFSYAYLNKASVGDKVIFAAASFPGMGGLGGYGTGNYTPPEPSHVMDYSSATSVLGNLSMTLERAKDPATLKLAEQMRVSAESLLKKSSEILATPKVEVELDGGKRTNCERLKPASNTFPCNLYECSKPSAGFYLNTQFGGGTFLQMNEAEDISLVSEPKALWSPLDKNKAITRKFEINGMMGGMGGVAGYGYGSAPVAQGEYDFAKQFARQTPKIAPQIASLTDPMFRMTLSSHIGSCDPAQVPKLKKALEGIREKIANSDLVQLVEVSNNILTSRFINPDAIPENACRDGEVWYRGQSYDLSRNIVANASPKTIDLKTANRLFKEARAMKDIAWDYKMDGCYARAHLMARRFEEQGVHVDKVWIKGDLRVPEAGIAWNFHVAPIVYVEDDQGNVQRMVIDPSLTDEPVTVEQWSDIMKKGVVGKTLETQFPFPYNSANFEHTSIAYSNSDPYLPMDQLGMSEEDKMDLSKDTMTRYLGYTR